MLVRVGVFPLVAFTPLLSALIRPAVLSGSRLPCASDFSTILHEEGHHLALRDFDVVHLLKESVLVECLKAKDRRALILKHLLRNGAFDWAATAFDLGSTAAPELKLIATVSASVMHVAYATVWTLDFAGKAAGVQ